MISDALLRVAAAEAEEVLMSNLPETTPHQFSNRFERKMKKLIFRADHPVRYRALRYAAVVLLTVVTLFSAAFAISPEVRAAVINWTKDVISGYTRYEGKSEQFSARSDYFLPEVPDGYTLVKTRERFSGKDYIYENADGRYLVFTYTYGVKGVAVYVEMENAVHYSDSVSGCAADVYVFEDGTKSNVILWQDEEERVLFTIKAYIEHDELRQLAEKIQKKD